MQNEKKYIRYKGITRLPSEHDSFDGELEDVVNMALTGGELRPVLPPEIIGTISGQLMFVHKNMGYEHFIYLDWNVVKAYKYESESLSPISCNINIAGSTLTRVDAVGNTLIILTSQDILYALWKPDANSYFNLGSNIPFPVLTFGLTPYAISGNKSFSINASDNGQLNYLTYLKTTEGTYLKTDAVSIDNSISEIADKFGELLKGGPFGDAHASAFVSMFEGEMKEAQGVITNKIMGIINSHISDQAESQRHIFPFLVRYALRLFDGSLVKHSPPFLMTPTRFIPFKVGPTTLAPATNDGAAANKEISILLHNPSKLTYSHSSSILSSYSDIVQSVDIFITPPIYTFVQDSILNGWVADHDDPAVYLFGGMYKSRDTIRRSISEASNFFLVHSIPVSEMSQAKSQTEVPMEKLNTLTNQEPMVDDYHSHDKIESDSVFVYNDKLHLSGIKRTKFPGFKLGSNRTYYSDTSAAATIGVGNQPFIFYPGKASKLYIDVYNGTQYRTKEISLIQHPRLNGSYYFDPDLKNIANDAPLNNSTPFDVIVGFGVQDSSILELNKLYVSAHQNPFAFPVSSRITLPVGKILTVASNTEAISQGQFGQFPLYAFTDDGIWALEVASDGKYTARQPVSREVATNSNIMQMDKALAFITAKGVSLLSGQNTEHISEIIRENNRRGSKLSISSILTALDSGGMQSVYNTDVPFETFTAGATLAFDHITGSGRIIVINPLYSYAYVFDIGSSSWSKIIASYKRVVNNYPDCYVQDGAGVIYNLAHIPDALDSTDCMFITRPIKYNDLNFVIRSLSHRGIFKSVLNVAIYASRNGQDYHLIKTGKEKLIRMTGSGYMYYKILVIANLKSNEVISGIDLDFMVKYSNRMR